MGPEGNITFGSGTLYFDDQAIDIKEGSAVFELSDLDYEILNKINSLKDAEFTCECKIKFKGLVMLMGFWPAVKVTVRSWWWNVRRLFSGQRSSKDST